MPRFPHLAVATVLLLLSASSATLAQETKPLFVFSDAGREAGLFPHVAGIAGHGVAWGDADGDGWPDLYVGTFGSKPYDSKTNQFFRNREGKFELDEQTQLRVVGRANGGVFADFDNDGDLDVLLTTNHGPAYLYRNDNLTKNHWFRVKLKGTKSNRNGLGAVVRVLSASGPQTQVMRSGSSYCSASELILTFGLGKDTRVDQVDVEWPSGRRSTRTREAPNQIITISEQ